MKILLDTNIVIHRETSQVVIKEIGILFRWLDNLRYIKCVHPLSVAEVNKHRDMSVRETFNIKMASYNVLQAPAALHPSVLSVTISMDTNENDKNDTLLLNELYVNHVDFLLTEDKKIHRKAALLHLADRVFRIEAFLEKIAAENPGFADYKVPSVRKELFGNIALDNEFFHSFREDYPAFDLWFQRKSEDTAYICTADQDIVAFLFLKVEGADEPYHGISPPFARKKRLKIGSFKVALNGFRLGERFL
ncbi:MAG: hypothetical protein JWN14_975, partial [Chthonomonadales bacterium]|nr:hypothetical protein [Chthonomonadales bacterium]